MQSAKTNLNVEEVFFSIARDIKQRLSDTDTKAEVSEITSSRYSFTLSHFIFFSLMTYPRIYCSLQLSKSIRLTQVLELGRWHRSRLAVVLK